MISFPFVGGEKILNPDNIVYVQTDGHRNIFYFSSPKESPLRVYMKLTDIEQVLHPYGFVRCHRSCLVNMKYVAKVKNYLLVLSTGEVFTISRMRYRMVKDLFNIQKQKK